MKNPLLIIVLLIHLSLTAQDLSGKWIIAKDSATVSLVETTVLKFEQGSLSIYDFKKFHGLFFSGLNAFYNYCR